MLYAKPCHLAGVRGTRTRSPVRPMGRELTPPKTSEIDPGASDDAGPVVPQLETRPNQCENAVNLAGKRFLIPLCRRSFPRPCRLQTILPSRNVPSQKGRGLDGKHLFPSGPSGRPINIFERRTAPVWILAPPSLVPGGRASLGLTVSRKSDGGLRISAGENPLISGLISTSEICKVLSPRSTQTAGRLFYFFQFSQSQASPQIVTSCKTEPGRRSFSSPADRQF